MSLARAARLLYQLPRKSRVYCALQPANQWGWQEVYLNKISYLLEVLAWQNTKDARRKSPQKAPKPFIPDFMRDAQKSREINKDAIILDVDQYREMLAKPRV